MDQGILEGGRAASPNPLPSETESQPDGVRLTVYDQGASLVHDRRTLELKNGLNDIELTDIAAKIDPTSVNFISLTDPRDTLLIEQNYRNDVSGRDTLLCRYLHEKIEITLEDGTRYSGELCSGRDNASYGSRPPFPAVPIDDIIVRQPDGQIVAIRQNRVRDIRFPEIEQHLFTHPTLCCTIESATEGSQQIDLIYQTNGLSWTAYYNLLLASNGRQFDFNGWVLLQNQSGTAFQQARVNLVQVNEQRAPQTDDTPATNPFRRAALTPPKPRFGDPHYDQTEARDMTRLQHFALQRPVSIAHGETRQVDFLTARAVPAQNYFIYDASMPFENYPSSPLKKPTDGKMNVIDLQSMLEFNVSALGNDLPAGTIRVYQESGVLLMMAENKIEYTPENEKLKLSLGRALELSGKRTQKEFRPLSRVLLEETYEIRLRNRRSDRGVRVHVPERLFRWNDWEILTASHEYTQIDATTIEFRVDVPALGETVIHYIVRYIWPG